VWLKAVQKSPFLIFGPAATICRLAPVWQQVFVPSMLVILLGMVQAAINLLRPDWVRFGSAARVGIGAITLVVVYFLVSGDHQRTMEIVNQTIFCSLLGAGVIVIALLLRDVWRLVLEHGAVASRAQV